MRTPDTFDELRRAARRRLPLGLFEYIDRGVGDEAALRKTRQRMDAAEILPRVLAANSARDISCTLFRQLYAAPIIIAPTAMAGFIEHNGEIAITQAATRRGLPVCLSTQSVISIERLHKAVPEAHLWMQLYLWQDRSLSIELMKRACDAGVSVLVMTVDTPYGARKEWNTRNGFGIPFTPTLRNTVDMLLRPGWLWRSVGRALLAGGLPEMENYPKEMRPHLLGPPTVDNVALRKDLNWEDVSFVRDHWQGSLVLKGILSVEDAHEAERRGAQGIVVSSHGARNFDAAPVPIDVVQDIASAASPRLTVLSDGGVQRGLDVLRYMQRGSSGVMLGRLPLWALAAGGADRVDQALETLIRDYVEALDFSGIGTH